MADDLVIDYHLGREERYKQLIPQLESLVAGETDELANLGNIIAGIKETFGFLWVGFYFVKDGSLVLGPFQGPVACTRIAKSKGVCGKSWELNQTIVVEDVDQFPGHIACSSASRSEIVLPVRNARQEVIGVLDVDSIQLKDFSDIDRLYLEKVIKLVESCIHNA
jgi:L-methionine (R)-S-oxide reductase